MTDKYILVDKHPVIENNSLMWATWMQTADRTVNKTQIGDVEVSTVFMGRDHQFGESLPLFFETRIFGGKHDGYIDRYSTWAEAIAGHDKAVDKVS